MNTTFIGIITVLVMTHAIAPASADTLFKCKSADGHTYFQDTKCAAAELVSSKVLVSSVVKMTRDNTGVKKEFASTVISQAGDGMYRVEGYIQDVPVEMMVDSGASKLTIPTSLANSLGLKCDAPTTMVGANNRTAACRSTVKKFQIGSIILTDVAVLYAEGIDTVLMGQSVLSRLKVEQNNGALTLTEK